MGFSIDASFNFILSCVISSTRFCTSW